MFVTSNNSLLAQLFTLNVSCTNAHLGPMLPLGDERDVSHEKEALLRPKWENFGKLFKYDLGSLIFRVNDMVMLYTCIICCLRNYCNKFVAGACGRNFDDQV
jgi:hypothetical protein